MTILAVANSKGGASKTTVVQCVSAELARSGFRVAVLDCDPNGNFETWHRRAYQGPGITVTVEIEHTRVLGKLRELASDHDVVIADTAGFGNQTATFAIGTAHHVLIPCQASAANVDETRKTAELVKSTAAIARREISYRALLTAADPRTAVAQHTRSELEKAGLPVLGTILTRLVAYQELTYTGTIPRGAGAGREIERLVEELQTLGWLPAQTAFSPAA